MERIVRLQRQLQQSAVAVAGMLITHAVDLYYLTGTMQAGMLFVPIEGQPCLYIRRHVGRAKQETALEVRPLERLRDVAQEVQAHYAQSGRCWAIAYDVLRTDLYCRLCEAFSGWTWVDGTQAIRTVRMIKEDAEIEAIRCAARAVDVALAEAWAQVDGTMTELGLLTAIEVGLRRQGHLGLVRARAPYMDIVTGIVSSGHRAAIPSAFQGPLAGPGLHPSFPKGASHAVLEPGTPIVIDLAANIDGYLIDQTRIGVLGEWRDDRWMSVYETSVEMLRALETMLRPGVSCQAVYAQARHLAQQSGWGDHFMGEGEHAVAFVGHGFGLEIDEWPVLAPKVEQVLMPGMVVAVEPKFVWSGQGAIGIENAYVITEQGCERLTVSDERIWHA